MGLRAWRALLGLLPVKVARLLEHEVRGVHSLVLWVARRRHGVPAGAYAGAYTGPQTAMMWGLIFVSVVEAVALAVLIPWPLVHRIVLVVDVYGVLIAVAMHAACVVRPHVVEPDGSLRLRWGALVDVRVPVDAVARVRVERRYPDGKLVTLREDGSVELVVGGQTTVAVDLARPVPFVRPLGARAVAEGTIRFHTDDPAAFVAAYRKAVEGDGRVESEGGVGVG
ncbi:hypothetical protein [Streptomyces sp. NPDC005805]|uniref:hypothetical protein n=1 Tax=Streptomyces sp. NPDC005805 TaxID=3157068 RepID=UPI003402048F